MTHKSLVNQLDKFVGKICVRKGLNPDIAVKGGEREIANSMLYVALQQLAEDILAAAGAPAPEQIAEQAEANAA